MSDVKLTQLDSREIPRYTYDEDNKAQRVYIVNTSPSGVVSNQTATENQVNANFKLPDGAQYEALKQHFLSLPAPRIETRVETVEVPVIVKEIQIVEVTKIITEYKEVEKIVIVTKTEIRDVEKLVLVPEYKTINVPEIIEKIVYVEKFNYKMFMVLQAITLALIIAAKLIK